MSDTGQHTPLIIRRFVDDYVYQSNVLGHTVFGLDSVGISLTVKKYS